MSEQRGGATWISGILHHHMLKLIVAVYILAAIVPALGSRIGGLAQECSVFDWKLHVTAPMALLAALLFAAGLGVKGDHLRGVFRRPAALALGLLASVLIPALVLLAAIPVLSLWPDAAEARD